MPLETPPTSHPAAAPADYNSAQIGNVVTVVRDAMHPTRIGPYHIIQLIGEGGMGTVYKAEQREPIHRIVAVKIIKLGMDTKDVIARFESERQALALMNHPNVARVLDAGATETGRPYFVMEFVAGEPITAFADRQKLTIARRLELFTQACDAVQHAHQKAIIHRDLKPSNILVTLQDNKPVVKVIDFGVAKAISHRLTEKTLFTTTGQLVGTPEYMAPEQAEQGSADVDTRSDIYSLGVVLYELLSGALPFPAKTLRSGGYREIQRIICEVDPPRPSTRLSSLGNAATAVALSRQTPLDSLQKQLKSELEWIPLKAMRKAPVDRYASATELAEDIANYLSSRPLRAGPETTLYRTRKFLRRNKAVVTASAAMVLLLVGGIIATTWQAIRATRAESRTRAAAAELRDVNRFLTDDLLFSASPQVNRGREMTVSEALDRAAESVSKRLGAHPLSEAAVRDVLADAYYQLGHTDRALPHAQASFDVLRRQLGPDDEQTLLSMQQFGRFLAHANRHAESEPILRDAVDRSRRVFGDDRLVTIECLSSLALTLRMQNRFDEAEPLLRRVLDFDRRHFGPDTAEYANSLNSLAVLLNSQRRASEAEPLYRQAIEIRGRLLGTDHPSYLAALANFSRVLHDQGKLAEAEDLMRQILRDERRVLKDDHPSTLLTMNNLAVLLDHRQKFEEAEALHREALERRRRVLGNEDIDTLQSLTNLGAMLLRRDRVDEAEPLLVEAAAGRRKVLGVKHAHTAGSMAALSRVYELQGRFADMESLLAEVSVPEVLSTLSADQQAITLARLGCCRARLNQFEQAEPVLVEAEKRLAETGQGGIEMMRAVYRALADVCDRTNRPQDAAAWRARLASIPSSRPATR